jgi:hypothetical protein
VNSANSSVMSSSKSSHRPNPRERRGYPIGCMRSRYESFMSRRNLAQYKGENEARTVCAARYWAGYGPANVMLKWQVCDAARSLPSRCCCPWHVT